jgi:YesN/AraC family two-component response regulator
MSAPVRVVVVDDQALVRGAFRLLVDSAPDLEVVGEGANGAEAVSLVGELEPDVVLMDIRMPVMDGLEATRAVAALGVRTRVLVVTAYESGLVEPHPPP